MDKEITLQPMADADIPFLHKLMNEPKIKETIHINETTFEYWQEAFERWQQDNDEENFIIYKSDIPVGWISLNGLNNADIAWVRMFAISPDCQKQGIGCHVVNYIVDYMKSKGFNKIGIHTNEENTPAQACYRKCGFVQTERSDCTNADGMARIGYTFEKNINENKDTILSKWNADVYDQCVTDTNDIEFLLSVIGKEPKNILEVCCGSGRILVPLAKAGHTVTGFDMDEFMMARIAAKAAGLSNIKWHKADAITDDWGKDFDIVVLAGNILINIVSEMDYRKSQELFIKKAAGCLKPGGYLYLDFHLNANPERFFGNKSERVHFEGTDNAGVYGKYSTLEGSYVPATQIDTFKRKYELVTNDGEQIRVIKEAVKHIPTYTEVNNWLTEYGFITQQEYGDSDKNPIGEDTHRAIIYARKA